MNQKNINIAIIGLGNIGSYLYKYLLKKRNLLTKKTNITPNVIYVSAKNKQKKRSIKIPKTKWLKNYLDAATHPKIDIVIEFINAFKKLILKKNDLTYPSYIKFIIIQIIGEKRNKLKNNIKI